MSATVQAPLSEGRVVHVCEKFAQALDCPCIVPAVSTPFSLMQAPTAPTGEAPVSLERKCTATESMIDPAGMAVAGRL
jgi:hypothetical protein